jgi:hypothetical protein
MNRILWFSIVVAFVLSGCAGHSEFFGVKMTDVSKAKQLKIEKYSIKSGVQYTGNTKYMDPDISAFGDLTSYSINITVSNKSNSPIRTNYLLDSFALISKDGKTYVLEKGDILSYPRANYINPGSSETFRLGLPASPIKKEDVSAILCFLGNSVKIVLYSTTPRSNRRRKWISFSRKTVKQNKVALLSQTDDVIKEFNVPHNGLGQHLAGRAFLLGYHVA